MPVNQATPTEFYCAPEFSVRQPEEGNKGDVTLFEMLGKVEDCFVDCTEASIYRYGFLTPMVMYPQSYRKVVGHVE